MPEQPGLQPKKTKQRRRTTMTEYEADYLFFSAAGTIKGLVDAVVEAMRSAQLLGKPHSATFCLLGDRCPTKDNHLPPYKLPERKTNGLPESGLPDRNSEPGHGEPTSN